MVGPKHYVLGGGRLDGTSESIMQALKIMKRMVSSAHAMVSIMYDEKLLENTLSFWNLDRWTTTKPLQALPDSVENRELKLDANRMENSLLDRFKNCCSQIGENAMCGTSCALSDLAVERFKALKDIRAASENGLFHHECWTTSFMEHCPRRQNFEALRPLLCYKQIKIRSTTDNERHLADVSKVWKSGRGKAVDLDNIDNIVTIKRWGPKSIQDLAAVKVLSNGEIVVTPTRFALNLHAKYVEICGKHFRTFKGRKIKLRPKGLASAGAKTALRALHFKSVAACARRHSRAGRGDILSILPEELRLKKLRSTDELALKLEWTKMRTKVVEGYQKRKMEKHNECTRRKAGQNPHVAEAKKCKKQIETQRAANATRERHMVGSLKFDIGHHFVSPAVASDWAQSSWFPHTGTDNIECAVFVVLDSLQELKPHSQSK